MTINSIAQKIKGSVRDNDRAKYVLDEGEYVDVTVERTSQKLLKFRGRKIGHGDNKINDRGQQRRRWMNVDVYEAQRRDGTKFYVAVVKYGGKNIQEKCFAYSANDPKALLNKLAKPDRRVEGELFVHTSISEAFMEAARFDERFEDALVIDLT
jgi:hypothetical protein